MWIEGLAVCAPWKLLWSSCRKVKGKLEPGASPGQHWCLQNQVQEALCEGWNGLAADSWEKGVSLTKAARTACTAVREHSSQLGKGEGDFLALASCFLNLASLKGCCRFLGLGKWRVRRAINTDPLSSSSSWMISSGHWCLHLVCPTH